MQLVYSGAHPEVVVDELDSEQVITAGKPVEIPDDLAARLLEQSTWARVGTGSILASPLATAQSVTAASTPTQADDATKAAS